jgi:hypothetical protein
MMGIFFARYAVAVALAMRPALATSVTLVAAASFAYGLMSGSFLARALQILGCAAAPRTPDAIQSAGN